MTCASSPLAKQSQLQSFRPVGHVALNNREFGLGINPPD